MRELKEYVNDPSAGSPTETLLRLLLPLNNMVYSTSCNKIHPERYIKITIRRVHRIIQSVAATGGVYKGQGRNHRSLMNYDY
jgi:hypothetical protein